MSTPKYTPGPWVAIKGDTFNPERPWGVSKYLSREAHIEIDGDDKEYPCRTEVIAELTETENPQEVEHTAYLIAAAPAMYEALTDAERMWNIARMIDSKHHAGNPISNDLWSDFHQYLMEWHTKRKNAIAQAEGNE